MTYRDQIKNARHKKGWSQRTLADIVGKSNVTISNIETGKRSTNIKTLQAICKALGLDINIVTKT